MSSKMVRTIDRDFSMLAFRSPSRFSLGPWTCFLRTLKTFEDGAFLAFSILSEVFLNS